MLGENHALPNEFPQYKLKIEALMSEDKAFAEDAKQYHRLDKEIRELALNNTPVGDETMHHKKQQRAYLKDTLYQQLLSTKNQ